MASLVLKASGSIGLRLLTQFSQFAFILLLGKVFTMNELGEYGLITSAILLIGYFLGLDVYQYNTREILNPKNDSTALITKQIKFFFSTYGVFFFLLLPVIFLQPGGINAGIVAFAMLITIFDHFSLESFRLFITLESPILANFLLFFRRGLWALLLILLYFGSIYENISLQFVLAFWLSGGLLTTSITLCYLHVRGYLDVKRVPFDLQWVKVAVRISLPYFISTLFFQATLYLNRYILAFCLGSESVGIFTFFQSISNILHVLTYTGIISQLRPSIIRNYNDENLPEFRKRLWLMASGIVLTSILIIFVFTISIDPVLQFTSKSELMAEKRLLYLLLASSALLSMIYVPSTILYTLRKDNIIFRGNMLGFIVNILLSIPFINAYGLVGAPVALLIALICSLTYFSIKVGKDYKPLLFGPIQ